MLLIIMAADLTLAQTVFSVLADERRAFTAAYLVEDTPLSGSDLTSKLHNTFPSVATLNPNLDAKALQSMNKGVLTNFGLVDSEPIVSATSGYPAMGWFATDLLRRIKTNYLPFGFAMGKNFNISLHKLLGDITGRGSVSPYSRVEIILTALSSEKPLSIKDISERINLSYEKTHRHVKSLADNGLVAVNPDVEIPDGELSYYFYWKSDKRPEEFPNLPVGNQSRKLIEALYSETSPDANIYLSADELSDRSGYAYVSTHQALRPLVRDEVVGMFSENAFRTVTLIGTGIPLANLFFKPLVSAINGNTIDAINVESVVAQFKTDEHRNLSEIMELYKETHS